MISVSGPSISNPVIPPRASGPESTPMASQFPLQSRAALDPRFHSHTQQPPAVPQTQTHPQPGVGVGVGHPVLLGTDQREKENGRNVHVGHDGGIDPVVTHASASTALSNGRHPVVQAQAQQQQPQQGASTGSGQQQAPQQSLPSLKASGLLEWPLPGSAETGPPGVQVQVAPSSASASASVSVSASTAVVATSWAVHSHSLAPPRSGAGREPARSPRSQGPVQSPSQTHAQLQVQAPSQVPPPSALLQSEAGAELRGGPVGPSSGMPVGLQWLAQESTVARQS